MFWGKEFPTVFQYPFDLEIIVIFFGVCEKPSLYLNMNYNNSIRFRGSKCIILMLCVVVN